MPPTSTLAPRRQATAAAKLKNNRLRPGTKVLGRPLAAMPMARSLVSAVSLIWPSRRRSSRWSSPRRAAHVRKLGGQRVAHHLAAVQLDAVALAVVEADGLHLGVAVQRPGQAGGGVLAAGEQHQGVAGVGQGCSHGQRCGGCQECAAAVPGCMIRPCRASRRPWQHGLLPCTPSSATPTSTTSRCCRASPRWVSRFHDASEDPAGQRLGGEARIWRDDKLRVTMCSATRSCAQLDRAALLVSVVTPRYLRSPWCTRELGAFELAAQRTGGVEIDHSSRVLKVLKTPLPPGDTVPPVLDRTLGCAVLCAGRRARPRDRPRAGRRRRG